MLSLEEIAEYIKSKIDTGENITAGLIDENVNYCIGVFDNNKAQNVRYTLGNSENMKYYKQNISILIHWGIESSKAQKKAIEIQNLFFNKTDYFINNHHVSFVIAYNPQNLGHTSNGICDYVIPLEFYINKEE